MKQSIVTASAPSAYVTKNKKRIKQFNSSVYLQNGDEFEIELFNPTQNKVLAKIEIDGKGIGGSGIVLLPGQRVFLERYIDVAKKFLFETYNVNGDNSEVQKAIANNGNVEIKFYNEYVAPLPVVTINNPMWDNLYYYKTTDLNKYNNITGAINGTFTTTNNFDSSVITFTTNSMPFTSCCTDSLDVKTSNLTTSTLRSKSFKKEIETGRVEKGSNSNQSFTYDYTTFNS